MKTGEGRRASGLLTLLLIAVLLTVNLMLVQVGGADSIWNMTYGGVNQDVARSVQQTSDGGYIVAGFTESFGLGLADFWLVKTNAGGTMQWNKTYGGVSVDEAYSVRQATDGGYVVTGFTKSFGLGNADFWLVKTEVNGVTQWSKTYGGVYDDFAFCVQQTSDMGYVLAGFTESFSVGERDFWLVKTDAIGNVQWNKTYGGAGLDQAFSVVQTSDGGYVLAGETDSWGAGSSDFWLVRTDSLGNLLWSRSFGGANSDVARSVQQASDGGYIIAGWTRSFGAGGTDYWLVKTDSLGNQRWNKTFGETFDDEAYSVQQTGDGGYIIAGGTTSFGLGGWDFWQVKTDANGNMQWNQANGGALNDLAYSVQQTSDGGYILAGSTESYGTGLADFWLTKNAPHPSRPPEEVHNIAILSVSPSKMLVGEGISISINVSVENQGVYDETSRISAYANATLIEASPFTLTGGEKANIILTWNTSGFVKGSYTISAVTDQVLEETNTADNTFVDGKVKVTIIGDVQGDGKVDVFDLLDLSKAYASDPSKSIWNPYCDFRGDDKVDLSDLFDLGRNYGRA